MIISFIELGYSNRELKQLFKVGGYRLDRIRKELKDPTLRAKKLAAKVPWHAFTDEDKHCVKMVSHAHTDGRHVFLVMRKYHGLVCMTSTQKLCLKNKQR